MGCQGNHGGAAPEDMEHENRTGRKTVAQFCELCGDTENLEVHHVHAMRKLHQYPGREKPAWGRRMIELQRKTLVLCKRCHEDVEHGLPLKKPAISLTEIRSRRRQTTRVERNE